jgi:hypothetical protein
MEYRVNKFGINVVPQQWSHKAHVRDRTSFIDDECKQSKVYTAADHFVKSTGTGELQLDAKLNRRLTNPTKLKNVLCVPDHQKNLLSVSSVTDNGYTVTFGKDRATINRKDGTIVLTATKRDHLRGSSRK